jgi:DnaJ-class molecular chaperone
VSSQQSRRYTDESYSNGHHSSEVDPFSVDNYYNLLNVPYNATRAQITRAYRQAMFRAHPDRSLPERRAAAEDIAKLLNIAYSTLTDPRKREIYDRTIRVEALQGEIMNRYIGGFGGYGLGGSKMPAADAPRRTMSEAERRDRARSDRSAMFSVFSAFIVITLWGIGLLLLFALASLVATALF